MARRIFIAADICRDLKNAIYGHTEKAFSDYDNVRIIPPENLHITMKFMGNTSDRKIEEIRSITSETVSCHKSFEYTVETYMDAFPAVKRAGIAYLGVGKGSEELTGIFNSLEEGLACCGIEKEKRGFYPHITAVRIKKPFDISAITRIPFSSAKNMYRVKHLSLYESILDRHGARYMIMERFILK